MMETETKRYDMHTHTRASDGMNSPSEQVRLAGERGLAGIAITDHDTVAGVKEALEEGSRLGIAIVPGVEISTRAKEKDIHILGYYPDIDNELLQQRLASLRATRDSRNDLMIARLQELGLEITLDEVIAAMGRPLRSGESLGRPHIADALVHKGYARDLRDAFDRYLAEGKAGYVSLPRIAPLEAMDWIREAGGVAVIAHPGLYGDDRLVEEIILQGRPDGIEVYHSDHGPDEEKRYMALAMRHALIPTGGSDYHGVRQGEVFHGELGSKYVTADIVQHLQKKAASRS